MTHFPPQVSERQAKSVAICATGPSMTDELTQKIKETFAGSDCRIIAVSDSYLLFPCADLFVASDYKWWHHHNPELPDYKCYAANQSANRLFGLNIVSGMPSFTNSTALAMEVATRLYRPERIYLFGADCHSRAGHHFFGSHPQGLKNTPEDRFVKIIKEIQETAQKCIQRGVHVLSCTHESDLHYGVSGFPPVMYTDEVVIFSSGLGVN